MGKIIVLILSLIGVGSFYNITNAQMYAIKSGDWSDNTLWSTTSGGASCSCIPDQTTNVYVDNNFTIRLDVSGQANSLFLSNGGNLDFSVNGTILSIFDTLEVASGSFIVGTSTAEIRFEGAVNNYFIVNDATTGVAIEEIDSYVGDTLFISGSGKIRLANDLEFHASQFVRMELTDTLYVGDNFRPRSSNVVIENYGILDVFDQFQVDASVSGSVFKNYGTAIFNNGVDLNGSPVNFSNYNLITSGHLQNIGNTNSFYNYNNATWNYHGATFDPDVNLFASFNNNTFIYSALTNQDIIQPQDSYYNIEFAGSGTKITTASPLVIDRDLTIRDDAVLDAGTFGTTINMVDDFRSFSTQADPFIPGAGSVIINGGNLTNSIESVHGIRFYNLEVNTNSRTRILSKDVVIENNFNIINGITYTETDGRLVIADNATITGFDNTKFIDGVITKIGDDAFLFPLGDGVYPGSLSISAPSMATTEYTVEYVHQAPANSTVNSPLINISSTEYWNLSQAVNNDDVAVTLHWQNATTSGIDDYADLVVASFDGISWNSFGQNSITATDPGNVQSTTIDTYQAVTYGSQSSMVNSLSTPAPRYSIASSNWDDPNTWSYTSGGPSCNCIPDENSEVHIESGFTVYIDNNATTKDLTVYNGAELRWSSNHNHIYIKNAGNVLVEDGGMIRSSGRSKLIFDQGPTGTLTVNDAANGFRMHTILFNAAGTYSIEGTGKIHCYDDLDLRGNINLTNNFTGIFTVRDNFDFESGNNVFVNNGKLTITNDDLYIKSNNNTITNNDTLHIATDNFYLRNVTGTVLENYGVIVINNDINLSGGNITINNYGSITHDEFISVDAGSEFHNRTNGTWTYRGSTFDPDVKLYASYADNTFIYSSLNDQNIIQPQDAYDYLELLGGGIKYTNFNSLLVNRDLILRDAVVLDPGTFGTNVTVGDDFESFSSQADPFLPGTTTLSIGMGQNYLSRINSANGIRLYNLEVNTTRELRNSDSDVIIENNVNFINGPINIDNTGRFIILDNATITGYDASQFITGPIQKIGDDPFTFPTGANGKFRPLSITAPANSTDAFTAYHRDQAIPGSYSLSAFEYVLDTIYNCSYWMFSQDAGSSQVEVTAAWNNNCSVPDLNHVTLASWDGSQWVDEGNSNVTGTAASGTVTSDGPIAYYEILALAGRTFRPLAVDDSYTTNEDQVLTDNILTSDSDPMGYDLSAVTTLVQEPLNGVLALNSNGEITYTPNTDYHGTDSIYYQVCNSAPYSKCDTAMVHFTILPVNDLPMAVNDTFQVNEDEVLNGLVLANDSEPEGQPLQATISQSPLNGNVTLSGNGTFVYTPNPDFYGNDLFEYEACDDQNPAGCSTAKVNIIVHPVNDPPVAIDDQFNGQEYFIISKNVMENDFDIDSQHLQTSLVQQPVNGTVAMSANGDFTYTPDHGFSGNDQFSYAINDNSNAGDTAIVELVVVPNMAPVAIDQTITIYEPAQLQVCLEATDTEGDAIQLKEVAFDPEFGNIGVVDSLSLCFTFNPVFEDNQQYEIAVVVCDPWKCDTATVSIIASPDVTVAYQALSPNNDGYNDAWIVEGIENYPNNEVQIFNRYGDLVYKTHGYNNDNKIWKGKANQGMVVNNSKELPEGTYFYTINLGNGSKPKQGYVVIAR